MTLWRRVAACVATIILAGSALCISGAALETGDVLSRSAVLMDADTGQVLYDKEMTSVAYPASTTKIMTALLVVENCDPDEMVTVSATAVSIDEPESTNVGLGIGEQISVGDLLYSMMLPSANDAANALAEHVAGSQEAFVEMMNERAWQIGARNTRFANAHGLDDPEHCTTAYDLALITRSAAQNPDFMTYFGATYHLVPPTNLQEQREYITPLPMLQEGTFFYENSLLGGKIGYTDMARHAMSTVATRDGRTLVCIVLNSPNREDKFVDTRTLLQYGFDEFRTVTLPMTAFEHEAVPMGDGDVSFYSERDFRALVHRDIEDSQIRVDYVLPDAFKDGDELPLTVRVVLEGGGETMPALLGIHPILFEIRDPEPDSPGLFRLFHSPETRREVLSSPAFPVISFVLVGLALVFVGVVLAKYNELAYYRKQRAARYYQPPPRTSNRNLHRSV